MKMKLVVLDVSGANIPGVPDAVFVKLCTHPNQIFQGAPYKERLAGTKATSLRVVKDMIKIAVDGLQKGELLYYVELEELQDNRQTIKLAQIDPAKLSVSNTLIEVFRGKFLTTDASGKRLDMSACSISSPEALNEYLQLVEIARFFYEEI